MKKDCLNRNKSVSELGQLVSDFGDLFLVEGFSDCVGLLHSLLVPFLGSFSSLVLELLDEVLLAPSDLAGKVTQLAELSEAAQLDSSQGIGNDLSLFGVVGSGDSFEDFQSAESSGTDGLLVGQHASDGSPEHSGGGSIMYVTSGGVG